MTAIPTRRESNTFLIGLFVLVGSVIVVGAILWVGTTKFFEEFDTYATYFDASVEGLERGRPVKYQGVPVGSISSVHLAPDGKLIEVLMQISPSTKIDTVTLRVKSEFSGITGGKFLQLYFPDPEEDEDLMEDHPTLNFRPDYPVIHSSPAGLQQLELALTDAVHTIGKVKTKKISNRLIDFLEEGEDMMKDGQDFLKNEDLLNAIKGADQSLRQINALLARIDSADIIDNVQLISQNLVDASERVQSAVDSLGKQVIDLRLAERLDHVGSRYDSVVGQASQTINMINYRTELVSFHLSEFVDQVQLTNRELKQTLRSLNENPSQTFFSEPPPVER